MFKSFMRLCVLFMLLQPLTALQASDWQVLHLAKQGLSEQAGLANINVLLVNKKTGELFEKFSLFEPSLAPELRVRAKPGWEYSEDFSGGYFALTQTQRRLELGQFVLNKDGINTTGSHIEFKVKNNLKNAQQRHSITLNGWLIRLSFNQQNLQLEQMGRLSKKNKSWETTKLPMVEGAKICDATLGTFNTDWSLYPEALVLYTYEKDGGYFLGATMTANVDAEHQKSYRINIPNDKINLNKCPTLTSFLFDPDWNNHYQVAVYFNELNLTTVAADLILSNLQFVDAYMPTDEDIETIASNGQSYATIRLKAQAGFQSDDGLFKAMVARLKLGTETDADTDTGSWGNIEIPSDIIINGVITGLLGSQAPMSTLDDLRERFIKKIQAEE